MDTRPTVRTTAIAFAIALLGALLVPALPAAAHTEDGSVTIETNSQFTKANGVRYGKGTKANPYVIEGWELGLLEIHDTDRYVVIKNNIIGTLRLNWIGNRVRVVNNRIRDLRVNENVERTGDMTSGLIAHNRFGNVGQLRHWDGNFSHNVVGTPPTSDEFRFDFFPGGIQAANLDGFNGARYAHNTFFGFVELRLHGHHHSSDFGEHSHYHGKEHDDNKLMHMNRYHSARFIGNRIEALGPYGLIYTDSNHAGNDRTATSETNEALNDPHVHHTKVSILRNEFVGSGIMVDIFNADDSQKHLRTSTGHFSIKGNSIKLQEYRNGADGWSEPPTGIEVHRARDLHLMITNNQVMGPAAEQTRASTDKVGGYTASGIELVDVEKAYIHLMNNTVMNRISGVYARDFNRVEWWIHGLRTEGVETKVDYDNSSSKPHGGP